MKRHYLKASVLITQFALYSAITLPLVCHPQEESFSYSPDLLKSLGIDPSALNETIKKSQTGTQNLDIFVNKTLLQSLTVEVIEKNNQLTARLPKALLLTLPVKAQILEKITELDSKASVSDITTLIPDASIEVDVPNQKLTIHIAQIWLSQEGHNQLPPVALWDYGQPSALINYNYSLSDRHSDLFSSNRDGFLSLNTRLNWGKYRLNSAITGSWQRANGQSQYEHKRLFTSIERDVVAFNSTLSFGELYTTSNNVANAPILGITLSTNEAIMPSVDKEFSPTIRGIAQSQARVRVYQMGKLIYQQEVPAGPFELTNIPNLSIGGELVTEIEESNGTIQTLRTPFYTSPSLLKKGRFTYRTSLGRYHTPGSENEKAIPLGLFEFDYGLIEGTTLNMGVYGATDYYASMLGLTQALGAFGALTLEANQSKLNTFRGERYGLKYLFYYPLTKSSLSLDYFRNKGKGYSTFSDAATYAQSGKYTQGVLNKDHWSIRLSQPLGSRWSTYLSSQHSRETNSTKQYSINAGLSANFGHFTLSLAAQSITQNKLNTPKSNEKLISLSLNIPLSKPNQSGKRNNHTLTTQSLKRLGGDSTHNMGLYGDVPLTPLTYNLSVNPKSKERSYNASLYYGGEWTETNLHYSQTKSDKSWGLTGQGSLLAYQNGLLLSKPIYGPSVIVETPNIKKTKLLNFTNSANTGDKTLVQGITNYRLAKMEIDPNSIPGNAFLKDYRQKIVPADDAVIVLSVDTFVGQQALVKLTSPKGPIPFAAQAYVIGPHKDLTRSLVDENGLIFFNALPSWGIIQVKWPEGHCQAPFTLKENTDTNAIELKTLICR